MYTHNSVFGFKKVAKKKFKNAHCLSFIESHLSLAKPKTVLCGRRVNLGDKVSNDLREGKITSFEIENHYFRYFKYIRKDNSRHYEQGIRCKNSLLFSVLNKKNTNNHILGSNFSCYKSDILFINGFDEDIIGGSKGDVDLEWRFIQSGSKLKSCKYFANAFHLNHKRNSRVDDIKIANKQINKNKKNNLFICKNGINKL